MLYLIALVFSNLELRENGFYSVALQDQRTNPTLSSLFRFLFTIGCVCDPENGVQVFSVALHE